MAMKKVSAVVACTVGVSALPGLKVGGIEHDLKCKVLGSEKLMTKAEDAVCTKVFKSEYQETCKKAVGYVWGQKEAFEKCPDAPEESWALKELEKWSKVHGDAMKKVHEWEDKMACQALGGNGTEQKITDEVCNEVASHKIEHLVCEDTMKELFEHFNKKCEKPKLTLAATAFSGGVKHELLCKVMGSKKLQTKAKDTVCTQVFKPQFQQTCKKAVEYAWGQREALEKCPGAPEESWALKDLEKWAKANGDVMKKIKEVEEKLACKALRGNGTEQKITDEVCNEVASHKIEHWACLKTMKGLFDHFNGKCEKPKLMLAAAPTADGVKHELLCKVLTSQKLQTKAEHALCTKVFKPEHQETCKKAVGYAWGQREAFEECPGAPEESWALKELEKWAKLHEDAMKKIHAWEEKMACNALRGNGTEQKITDEVCSEVASHKIEHWACLETMKGLFDHFNGKCEKPKDIFTVAKPSPLEHKIICKAMASKNIQAKAEDEVCKKVKAGKLQEWCKHAVVYAWGQEAAGEKCPGAPKESWAFKEMHKLAEKLACHELKKPERQQKLANKVCGDIATNKVERWGCEKAVNGLEKHFQKHCQAPGAEEKVVFV